MRKQTVIMLTVFFLFTSFILAPMPLTNASLSAFGNAANPPVIQYSSIFNASRGSAFTTPASVGVAVSITALIFLPTSGFPRAAQAAIYTEGETHNLVATSIPLIIGSSSDSPQWITFPLINPPLLAPNTPYVLTVWAGNTTQGDNTGTGPKLCYYGSGLGHLYDANAGSGRTGFYQGFPNTLSAEWNENNVAYCIYCTYIPSGSSATLIQAHSPINLLLIDSSGHRVGYDSVTGTVVNTIQGATYSGPNTEPQTIILPDVVAQTFTLQLFGTASGSFTVTVNNLAGGGTILGTKTWTGTATPNQLLASTFSIGSDGSIVGEELFVVPEYVIPITGLCTCFLAFIIFNKRQKLLS